MHKLSFFAVRRPITISVLVIIVVLFGIISLPRIGIDLLPNLDYPAAVVVTAYPGAHPEMVEKDVTIPIESALAGVSGINRIDAYSSESLSAIIVQLDMDVDMLEILERIRYALAQVTLRLPADAEAPIVARIDPNDFPLMIIGVNSDTLTDQQITSRLEELRPRIEQIQGVAEVGLLGARTAEIQVIYDPYKLDELGLNPTLLQQLITYQNVVVPSGAITDGDLRYNLRVGNTIESIDDLSNLIVGQKTVPGLLGLGGLLPSLVHLSDIAEIKETLTTPPGITRLNGEDTVLLRISRQPGANTVQIANQVNKTLQELALENPDLNFITIADQSIFIKQSVENLASSGVLGAVLALIVLFIFLRNLRSVLIIGLSIPISIIATFILLLFGNLNLNLMSLGGLALGTGMLVDSSIVVLENIYRYVIKGEDAAIAAEKGSRETATAIFASTVTTLVVFLPVIYMQSIAGEIFKELGLTVSFSLFASLIVALTLVPMFSSRLFRNHKPNTLASNGTSLTKIQKVYKKLLEKALAHKGAVLGAIVIALLVAVFIYPNLGSEFLPEIDENNISLKLTLPPGVSREQTKDVIAQIEEKILAVPEVVSLAIQAGDQGSNDLLSLINNADLYTADLQIGLTPKGERQRTSSEIAKEVRQIALDNNAVKAIIQGSASYGAAATVLTPQLQINVRGDDLDTINEIADQIVSRLEANPGYIQVVTSRIEDVNDLFLHADPARSILGGLTAGQVGLAVRQATTGLKATDLQINSITTPVVLMPKGDPTTLSGLMESTISSPIPVPGMEGTLVRLDQIVEEELRASSPLRHRRDRRNAVNVIAQLGDINLFTATNEAYQIIDDLNLPPGYSAKIDGLSQVIEETKNDLYIAMALAILLVYLVMSAQFESFLHPFVIMVTVPLAAIGAVFSLWITGLKLSITALIGLITLIGIVVNNAIVLVDYINARRREGVPIQEAVIDAALIRIRPILMTSLTTILGLIPMALAIGEGSEITAPIAVTLIGGLVTSTFLTLFVIPILYCLISALGKPYKAPDVPEQ